MVTVPFSDAPVLVMLKLISARICASPEPSFWMDTVAGISLSVWRTYIDDIVVLDNLGISLAKVLEHHVKDHILYRVTKFAVTGKGSSDLLGSRFRFRCAPAVHVVVIFAFFLDLGFGRSDADGNRLPVLFSFVPRFMR